MRAGEGGRGRGRAGKIRIEYITLELNMQTGRRGRERAREGRHLLGPLGALSLRAPVLLDAWIVALQACTARLVSFNRIGSNHKLQ